jgi:hypothetical protein
VGPVTLGGGGKVGAGSKQWPAGDGEMTRLVREHDWSATPLGPAEDWPQSLKTAVDLLLAGEFPMIALWGEKLVQIYNDGYRRIMADKHPEGLGQPTRECWPEVWPINEPIYERVFAGETLTLEDKLFPIARHGSHDGHLEDAWFTLCYSPLRDEDGVVAGVLVNVLETTERREGEERQAFLLALADRLRPIADPVEVMIAASEALGRYLGVGRCGYGEVDATGAFLTVERDWTDGIMASLRGTLRLDDFGPEFIGAYRAGRTVVVGDALADPRARGV